jgi:two-component system cell cycle response regulator
MAGKFLIASKNRKTVGVIENALKSDRHKVFITPSGMETIDLALDKQPNAIFLSVALKDLNGLETARALRSLTPTETVPIIFLAENAEQATQIANARFPLTECLTAPFDPVQVRTHAAGELHTREHVAQWRRPKTENAWMLAILDPLTQLYHRRYLMHRLAYEAKRSLRYNNPLAVMLVDIDNLKEINRQYGIVTGDTVLIEAGQLLLSILRNSEIVGRNDVQDFLVIVPQTDEPGLHQLAERVRQTIAEHHFVLEKLDLHVTVSVGTAWTNGADLTESLALIARAEVALSHAKRAGKNRVEVG